MIYTKITHGWVAQQYDSETGDCVRQEFIPEEGAVEREDEEGNPIAPEQVEELEHVEKECPFDMVQP